MQKYMDTKEEYPGCILFYRLGDFYEMFFEDAKTVSKELELTLTGKECGLEERAPMCGVPYHAVDSYLSRLVQKGYKVAIAEQMEDPKQAKGLVKREVIRVVTPGTITSSQLFHLGDRDYVAVALDGVLQSGGRQGVLHRRLGALSGQQEIDQAAVKAVVPVLKVRPFASVLRVDSSNSTPSRPK